MIMVKHVLKDGTPVDDIAGHVIKAADHPLLYEVIDRISKAGDANAVISASD